MRSTFLLTTLLALVASMPDFDSLTRAYIISIKSETPVEKIIELKEAIVRGGGSIDNQRETPDQIFAVVPINAVYVFFHSNIVQGHVIDSAHSLSKREVNQVPDFVFPDEV